MIIYEYKNIYLVWLFYSAFKTLSFLMDFIL